MNREINKAMELDTTRMWANAQRLRFSMFADTARVTNVRIIIIVMAALPNIAGALCSTPQSLAGAHCSNAVQ